MGAALKLVMPDTRHGLCAWHISQNSQKHLMRYNKNGMNLAREFSDCMFKFEEKDEFEDAFKKLMEKVDGKTWLRFIYDSKEKWAYYFMKDAYTLGIPSTQGSESINSILKNYLNCKLNIDRFMEQFDEVHDKKREKVIKFDYEMKRALPKIKFNVPILRKAGELYTQIFFELFQAEFELSCSAQIESIDGNTYTVGIRDINNEEHFHKSRQVVWNRNDQTILCSCKKFEREGIVCWHALKVLDREDVKFIPPRYILKRWTRVTNEGTVVDREGRTVIEDAMLEVRNRNGSLIREVAATCTKAAYDEEQTQFLRSVLCFAVKQYEEKYGNLSRRTNDYGEANPSSNISENSLHLKKKDSDKSSKRKRP